MTNVGIFFTLLKLEMVFTYVDESRRISESTFVLPSLNEILLTLNTAQLLCEAKGLQLIPFDGNLTLCKDAYSVDLAANGAII